MVWLIFDNIYYKIDTKWFLTPKFKSEIKGKVCKYIQKSKSLDRHDTYNDKLKSCEVLQDEIFDLWINEKLMLVEDQLNQIKIMETQNIQLQQQIVQKDYDIQQLNLKINGYTDVSWDNQGMIDIDFINVLENTPSFGKSTTGKNFVMLNTYLKQTIFSN